MARKNKRKTRSPKREIRPRLAGGDAVDIRKLRDDQVTLEYLREMMRAFVREREWGKFHTPRNLAASVAVEAAELLEHFQWLTPEEAERRCREDDAFRHAVGEELCDVLMYLMSLANAMGLEVGKAVFAKMARNRVKYPAERFRGRYERPLR